MDVLIIVETTFENGTTKTRHLGCLSRTFRRTQPEGFGLLLEDAKTILRQLQNVTLRDQIEEISEASRICPDCDRLRAIHDYRSRALDTLFGRFQIKAPRIRRCGCNARSDVPGGPLSPLAHFFPNRSAPELQRLRADLGARHSFRETRARRRRWKGPPHPRLAAYRDAYSARRDAAKGLLQIGGFSGIPVLFKRTAEALLWHLWHGKVMTATTSPQWLMVNCARLNTDDRPREPAAWLLSAPPLSTVG